MNNSEYLDNKYEELIRYFRHHTTNQSRQIQFMYSSEIFPNYYAGAHLTDDNHLKLMVTSTEDNGFLKNFFSSNLVDINVVEHSLDDLLDMYIKASDATLNIKNKSISVNQLNNIIDVTCNTESDLNILKKVFEENNIDLKYFNFIIDDVSVSLVATQVARSGNCVGTPDFYNDKGELVHGIATISCNVYNSRNNTYGIVTCEHICDDYR